MFRVFKALQRGMLHLCACPARMSMFTCTEAGMHLTSILSGAKHCLPTYLPYVFYEGSRATDAIYPASIATAILAVLLIILLDIEAASSLMSKASKQPASGQSLLSPLPGPGNTDPRRYRPVPV